MMDKSKPAVRDIVCGMIVDEKTALQAADKNGTVFYFCSEQCRKEFLNEAFILPHGKKPDSCCGS